MLRKKNATPNLSAILDEDARRAEAQKAINRTITTFVVTKVVATAAIAVAARIIIKKMEQSEADSAS